MPVPKKIALTLAGVRKDAEASSLISTKECSEICSALKRFAEIAGVDPESTLAEPAVLRKHFESQKWRLQELSPGRWSNIKTLVKKALALAGVDIHRTRTNYAVDPAWELLMAQLSSSDARDLRRFAGVCTGWAILPDEVDATVFERFLAFCTSQMVLRNPRERWHVARRAWNRAVTSGILPERPTIDAPDLPIWKVRSWSELPASLKLDFDHFIAARTKMRLITQKQQCLLRPVTVRNYDLKIRTLATCAIEAGIQASALTKLDVVVGAHILEAGLLQYMRGEDLENVRARLSAVGVAVRAIASWLIEEKRISKKDATAIREICDSVKHTPNVMTERNAARLAQFKDPAVLRKFLDLPHAVIDRLGDVEVPTVRQAQDAQLAALVCLLVHAPVRIGNAAQLAFGVNIARMKKSGETIWLLEWKEKWVKNKITLRHELGPTCTAILERYCSKFRPILAKEAGPGLFPNQVGKAKDPSTLSKQLSSFVARETGITLNAHGIRHLIAYLWFREHPGDYKTIQRLLGHKSIETTINFYLPFENEVDQAAYDDMISRLRRRSDHGKGWEDRL